MLTPNSYRDEPFSWLRESRGGNNQGTRRREDDTLREVNEEAMADHSEENVPLLSANASAVVDHPMEEDLDDNGEQYEEEEEESSHRSISGEGDGNLGTTVNCRVCDAVIQLEGRSLQHVVKCGACQEATPIRPAPPGKKYVRCPCNCLLICKASSTRIACPRQNCRRVITLGQSSSPGTAMQAPTGTCRVACAYCEDIFMFNTLSNALATCPHCRKESAVGGSYRRSRLIYFTSGLTLSLIFAFVFTALAFLTNAGTILETFFIISLTVLYALGAWCTFKALKFYLARISTIVAPV